MRVALALLVLFALPARADRIELRSGQALDGAVLAGGPLRLVVDGPQGVVFVERSAVRGVVDALGQPVPLPVGEVDPVGVVRVLEGGVRVQRRDVDVPLSIHGAAAVVLEGDVLRTTPYGRVTLVVAGGAQVSARGDAVVRFRQGTPELVEGTLRLELEQGTARVLLPEGRLVVTDGRAQAEHVRGRSRLLCVSGRAVLQAHEGYTLELPRNHAVDVKAAREREPASVAASNANAWPVRLEQGDQWVSVQPGERVVLLGLTAERRDRRGDTRDPPAEPLPERAPPAAAPQAARRPEQAPGPRAGVGVVVRAAAKLQLDRPGEPSRRLEPAEAEGFSLWPGDALVTADGNAWVEASGARVQVGADSRLTLRPPEGGPAFRLRGEATFETEGQVSVGVGGGEVGLLRGRMVVQTGDAGVALRVAAGTAGARLGDEVRAELLAPADLRAVFEPRGRVRLSVPADGQGVEVTAGTLDLRLAGQRWVSHGRTGDLQTIDLWSGARLELLGQVRARVLPGPAETELLAVDGLAAPLPLVPGTYRIAREGAAVRVLGAPPGAGAAPQVEAPLPPVAAERRPSPPAPAPAQPAPAPDPRAGGDEAHAFKNGAVVTTRGWGPVRVVRDGAQEVELEGPNGRLFLGPNARATLSRRAGAAGQPATSRVETTDGRWVEHEEDAAPFDLWLGGDGRLRVSVRGEAQPRGVEVEPGCSFDLTIRRDRYVLANVFGQVVYVDLGQQVSVTRRSGLRVRPGK
ncbi:MAG: hypothetical protein M9894_22725 [Planctomycetes bacterium]|nr:hypothetical protein [Planctomycetota bacterium]